MPMNIAQLPPIAASDETGALGIRHLKRFWSRQIASAGVGMPEAEEGSDWVADNTMLCGLRVGLRETYDYIFQKAPCLAEFESWILAKNGGSLAPDLVARLNAALSEEGIAGQRAD